VPLLRRLLESPGRRVKKAGGSFISVGGWSIPPQKTPLGAGTCTVRRESPPGGSWIPQGGMGISPSGGWGSCRIFAPVRPPWHPPSARAHPPFGPLAASSPSRWPPDESRPTASPRPAATPPRARPPWPLWPTGYGAARRPPALPGQAWRGAPPIPPIRRFSWKLSLNPHVQGHFSHVSAGSAGSAEDPGGALSPAGACAPPGQGVF
jgi:hypothetical protein